MITTQKFQHGLKPKNRVTPKGTQSRTALQNAKAGPVYVFERQLSELRDMPNGLVVDCVQEMYTVLICYGLDRPTALTARGARVRKAIVTSCKYYLSLCKAMGPDSWMDVVKYKLAAFFHSRTPQSAEGVEPPHALQTLEKKDNPRHLFTGIAMRFCDAYFRRNNLSNNLSLATSLLQSKRGMPRPTKKMVGDSIVKSFTKLTTIRPDRQDEKLLTFGEVKNVETKLPYESWNLNRDNMCRELRRTVYELFEDKEFNKDLAELDVPFPSTSACYERTTKEGGAAITIANDHISGDELLSDYGRQPLVRFRQLRRHFEEEGIYAPEADRVRRMQRYAADTTRLELAMRDLYRYSIDRLDLRQRTKNEVKLIGLAEALKVRTISKGRALRGFVLKPLQQFLWKTLYAHPVFKLIGTPVTQEIVQQAMGSRLEGDEAYLSGDYSDATNNLCPWVSETIATSIIDVCGLDDTLGRLFVEALTMHQIEAPPGVPGVEQGTLHPQRWGQLMGSVISFPILCIANAAMCRWAQEIAYERRMSLTQAHLLINGDDCLLRTNQQGLRAWKKISSFGGLEPSIGKFYYSRAFANINSTNFVRLEDEEAIPYNDPTTGRARLLNFKYTPFVNMGLLKGLKRSGGTDVKSLDPLDGIGARASGLMSSCPEHLRLVVWREFLNEHKEKLSKAGLPWYVPLAFGGLGLPSMTKPGDPGEDDIIINNYGPSLLDRKIVTKMLAEPQRYQPARLVGGNWEMWKLAKTLLPAQPSDLPVSRLQQANFDYVMNCTVRETLFKAGHWTLHDDHPMLPNVFMAAPSVSLLVDRERDMRKVYSKNRKLYAAILKTKKLTSKPITIQHLLNRPPPIAVLAIADLESTVRQ
jgi:hypothetical protein